MNVSSLVGVMNWLILYPHRVCSTFLLVSQLSKLLIYLIPKLRRYKKDFLRSTIQKRSLDCYTFQPFHKDQKRFYIAEKLLEDLFDKEFSNTTKSAHQSTPDHFHLDCIQDGADSKFGR